MCAAHHVPAESRVGRLLRRANRAVLLPTLCCLLLICRPAQFAPVRYGSHLEAKVLSNFDFETDSGGGGEREAAGG